MTSHHTDRDMQALLHDVLREARQAGADEAEADIGTGRGLSVTVRMGEVEAVEHQRDKGLSVTVYFDHHKGSASTTDFNAGALRETVQAACTIARNASRDPYAGLVDAELLAREVPDLDLHHPWELAPEQAIATALECEQLGRDADARVTNADGTVVSTYSGTHQYANSHGFCGGWAWSSHGMDCALIAQGVNGMQRDGWYTRARARDDLEDIHAVAREAARRTTARLDARKLSTRNAPVIFEAPVAGGLFGAFIGAVSGGALYRKASFLLDRAGDRVFAPHVNISERPHLPRAMGSAPFDGDGMATRDRELVTDGVLQGYVLSAYSARKLNLPPTGNAGGVHNLLVSHSAHGLDALLRRMDTGLLVTDLIGFGVNQVTGDYSRGASGFWVEGGEIRYPVEEITIAGNLLDMYAGIVEIGADVDRRGNIQTGSVLIEQMTIAGD